MMQVSRNICPVLDSLSFLLLSSLGIQSPCFKLLKKYFSSPKYVGKPSPDYMNNFINLDILVFFKRIFPSPAFQLLCMPISFLIHVLSIIFRLTFLLYL